MSTPGRAGRSRSDGAGRGAIECACRRTKTPGFEGGSRGPRRYPDLEKQVRATLADLTPTRVIHVTDNSPDTSYGTISTEVTARRDGAPAAAQGAEAVVQEFRATRLPPPPTPRGSRESPAPLKSAPLAFLPTSHANAARQPSWVREPRVSSILKGGHHAAAIISHAVGFPSWSAAAFRCAQGQACCRSGSRRSSLRPFDIEPTRAGAERKLCESHSCAMRQPPQEAPPEASFWPTLSQREREENLRDTALSLWERVWSLDI